MSGDLLQTFYLMFKSNAKEAIQDTKNLQEATDKAEKQIKKTKEETNELGKAFTDAVESGIRALAAYTTFSAMKTGILDAQQFNRQLTIQAQLWKQNANELNAWGAAAKQAGGSAEGLLAWYDSVRQQQAARGTPALPIGQLMSQIRQQVKGLSPEMAQHVFQRYGLSDIGMQSLLTGSDENWNRAIAEMDELTNNTEKGAKAAQEFGTAMNNLETAMTKFWTTVNTVILPPLTDLINGMTDFFKTIADNEGAAIAAFTAMAVSALLFSTASAGIVAGFSAMGAGAMGVLPLLAKVASAIAIIAAGGAMIWGGVKDIAGGGTSNSIIGKIAKWYSDKINEPYEARFKDRQEANRKMREGMAAQGDGSAMGYLMSKYGLSANHAAAIVSNMQHESGGNILARGDGGKAHGLFQWHPERRAKILKGTGIDVSSASMTQQLDAMMWELKDRGQLDPFLKYNDAGDAARYFAQRYEVHGGGWREDMERAQTALDIAASTPFASQSNFGVAGGNQVTIDKIEVVTQATDAEGIARDFGNQLKAQINNIFSQNNDGVAY